MSAPSTRAALQPPAPVMVLDLLSEDRAALLALLDALDADDWTRPTACDGWSVKDVASHILGGDLGNLSRRRDGYQGEAPSAGEDIVAHVNRINDEWMRAARRLSPRVVRDLLETVGPPLLAHFASLDLLALRGPVSWAGPDPAPTWLDVAREYTERWHHQQHIRDAVGQPGQTSRRFLHPVLATFAHALPQALRDMVADDGTVVHLHIRGEAGGDWTAIRDAAGWSLVIGEPPTAVARANLDQGQAWRLFTRGSSPEQALAEATLTGDQRFGRQVLEAVAIIA